MESRSFFFCGSSETYASQIGSFPQIKNIWNHQPSCNSVGVSSAISVVSPVFQWSFWAQVRIHFWEMLLQVENNGLEETKET